MCGRRGASCREDCQRSMKDTGGRAAGRRMAPEVSRSLATFRRGRAHATPSPHMGEIPMRSEVPGFGLASPLPDRSSRTGAEVRIPHGNPISPLYGREA
jgi:hypothetical protein